MTDRIYLGIDIGGTAVKFGLVNGEGVMVSEVSEYSVKFDNYETPIIETVVKSVKEFMSKNNKNFFDINGIGVSATGGINSKLGIVEGSAGHIKNWEGTNIKKRLEAEFGMNTAVLNDANAAALGEMWKGAAKGRENVVVMTIGTGVGGGIIVDSKILLGSKGFAGEIGHIPVNVDGEECSCGNTGCIEHYGSTSALVRNIKNAVISGEIIGINEDEIDGRLIFKQVSAGNKVVIKYVDEWINYISAALVGLVHIFNPEMVILGGGVSKQKEFFVDKVRDKVLHSVMDNFAQSLSIEAAELGNNAGIIGAVKFVIDA
ncbi:MAG: ROK family protein [Catonella sp.]